MKTSSVVLLLDSAPLTWTSRLSDAEADRLFEATRATLHEWIDRLRAEGCVEAQGFLFSRAVPAATT